MIPYWDASLPIVVLSPPGMMSASRSSSCSGRRTSTPSAPMPRSVVRCSLKSPWRPRTPTRAVRVLLSPTADGKTLAGGDGLKREAAHRLSEAAGHFGDELRVVVMGRRFDDRLRSARRILGFVDARSDEVAFRAELHGQSGIGRRRDATGAEEDHGQPLVLRDLAHQLDGDPVLL